MFRGRDWAATPAVLRSMAQLTDSRNSIKDINTHCLDQFKAHADCLENNNHYLFECRKAEVSLNSCIFDKLVCAPSDCRSLYDMQPRLLGNTRIAHAQLFKTNSSLFVPHRASRRLFPVLPRTRSPSTCAPNRSTRSTPDRSTKKSRGDILCFLPVQIPFTRLPLSTRPPHYTAA